MVRRTVVLAEVLRGQLCESSQTRSTKGGVPARRRLHHLGASELLKRDRRAARNSLQKEWYSQEALEVSGPWIEKLRCRRWRWFRRLGWAAAQAVSTSGARGWAESANFWA